MNTFNRAPRCNATQWMEYANIWLDLFVVALSLVSGGISEQACITHCSPGGRDRQVRPSRVTTPRNVRFTLLINANKSSYVRWPARLTTPRGGRPRQATHCPGRAWPPDNASSRGVDRGSQGDVSPRVDAGRSGSRRQRICLGLTTDAPGANSTTRNSEMSSSN